MASLSPSSSLSLSLFLRLSRSPARRSQFHKARFYDGRGLRPALQGFVRRRLNALHVKFNATRGSLGHTFVFKKVPLAGRNFYTSRVPGRCSSNAGFDRDENLRQRRAKKGEQIRWKNVEVYATIKQQRISSEDSPKGIDGNSEKVSGLVLQPAPRRIAEVSVASH